MTAVTSASAVSETDGLASGLIDADTHPFLLGGMQGLLPYVPKAWQERFLERIPAYLIGQRYHPYPNDGAHRDAPHAEGEQPASDPALMVQDWLEPRHIVRALLLSQEGVRTTNILNPSEAAMVTAAFNDYFAAEWLDVDQRYRYAMTVTSRFPPEARMEIERFGGTRGVVAIYLPLIDQLLGHPHYYPIYEAAQDADLPIVVHPQATIGNVPGCEFFAGGVPATAAERHVGYSQLAFANVPSLVFDGVFERFPKLRIAFSEFGFSWLPPLLWRMDAVWRAFRRDVPWVKAPPSEYVNRFLKFTTQPCDETGPGELEQIINMFDAENLLMFSSDYPHFDADDPFQVFVKFDQGFKTRVMHDNAAQFYGPRLTG